MRCDRRVQLGTASYIRMNKYLACFSVLALSFCLAGAVTIHEMERLIHLTNAEVRVRDIIAIKNTTRDALSKATSPLQRICIINKQGPAYQETNLILNQELATVQDECRAKTAEEIERMEDVDLAVQLLERYNNASPAEDWIDQINQCVESIN